MAGYFDSDPSNPTANPSCSLCSYTCVTCANSDSYCTSCSATQFRTLSATTCPCNTGYFDNNTAICAKCHYSCQQCTNSTSCSVCDQSNGRKQAIAGVGYCLCTEWTNSYDDGKNVLCVKCNYKCVTCDAQGCLTCHSTRTLSANTCLCNIKYYDDGTSTDCKPCDVSCQSCTNISACATCDSVTSYRIQNISTGLCSCLPNFYETGSPNCNACD